MAKPDYIYAVARIRAKELLCFGSPRNGTADGLQNL